MLVQDVSLSILEPDKNEIIFVDAAKTVAQCYNHGMMDEDKFDVAVVGAGILGLAHALAALENGNRVVLFERDNQAMGASIRNFGMVWPIGQPTGQWYDWASISRERWLRLSDEAGIWVNPCGSLHIARRADEWAVLEEFVELSEYPLELFNADQTLTKTDAVNPDGLLGAMWSPTELCVNPRQAIPGITNWLMEQKQLVGHFGTTVVEVSDENQITTSVGQTYTADRVVVCSGADFETLFPAEYRIAGLRKCKLQMLSTVPQNSGWKLGPHIAGGLTLRHYQSFQDCPSLGLVRQRVAHEQPELDRYGIHVMAAMNNLDEVVIGDSHVYDQDISPFDSNEIDEMILAEIQKLIRIPNLAIRKRWHGIYAKHPDKPIVKLQPHKDCQVVTAPGGAGMTLSFGIAEQTFKDWT